MLKNRKIQYLVIILFLIIFLIVFICIKNGNVVGGSSLEALDYDNNITENDNEQFNNYKNDTSKIVIHIAGAVKKEGVYEIMEGSRVADVIEIAGGLLDDSDISSVNLAEIVYDGTKIYIPKKNEEIKNDSQIVNNNKVDNDNSSNKNNKTSTNSQKININSATQTELETLPGIGPSTAMKIIEYRNNNGKFKNIDEIRKVTGIGENKYEKIKFLIKT